jgi:hypothetical protein
MEKARHENVFKRIFRASYEMFLKEWKLVVIQKSESKQIS